MSNTDSAPIAQAIHDLGTALWFGGSVMGVAGVNKSGNELRDELDKIRVAGSAWKRFAPAQWGGVAASIIGGALITNSNKGRLAGQSGFAAAGATKAALTVVGVAATAFAAYSGNKIGQAAEAAVSRGEQFEVKDATSPAEKTPAEVATWQKRQRIAQVLVPATSGALVVLNSYLVQQYRPAATAKGLLGRLTRG
ncbi:MAG TPA: hypothetical protein VI357_15835 [Mycobacteriales bacterium]